MKDSLSAHPSTVDEPPRASSAEASRSSPDLPFVLGLLAVNLVAWTLYAAISHSSEALHEDMTEAYAWGREFQLGYYKHPPFWAWLAGFWFLVLPSKAWIFSMLSVLNANVGLLGAWLLLGRFAEGKRRAAAAFLLLLTPCYGFLALKYNANAIFLSLWPWMAYHFVRAIDDGRRVDAVLFGALSAAALLSKYYAVILLATCLLAACLHPQRKRYFASASPYVSAGVAALLVAPHVWWLVASGFPPIHYALSRTGLTLFQSVGNAARYLLGCLAFHAFVIFLILLGSPMPLRQRWRKLVEKSCKPRVRFLAVLAVGPTLLTAVAGLALHFPLAPNISIGLFCLVPLLLMALAGADDSARLLRIGQWSVAGFTVAALLASPVVAYEKMRQGEQTAIQPRMEIADAATRLWRQQTGTALAIIAGYSPYADAVAFYSTDHPSDFIAFDFGLAPWITPEAIARDGYLAVCLKDDETCLATARKYASRPGIPVRVEVFHHSWGISAPPVAFDLLIVPPRP